MEVENVEVNNMPRSLIEPPIVNYHAEFQN